MKALQLDISDVSKLQEACKQLVEFAGPVKVFAFEAEMGAGKTTFIKELCSILGSNDSFSSPTYSIVNEYNSPIGKLFHFDLYRLNSAKELLDIGFEEYVDSSHYCFIEWPEKALPFLPKPFLSIIINVSQNNRYLSAQIID